MKEKSDYLRVTEVLAPFSGLNSVPKDILDNACRRGDYVHARCDAYISGIGSNESHPIWDKYFESFLKWVPKNFIEKPERFYCDKHMLTGECDAIYEENGELVLVDFKTPEKEGKTWLLQGSAYSYLAKKSGYKIDRIEFVKLSKDGSEPTVYQYKEDFKAFEKCLYVYNYFFKGIKSDPGLDYI